MARTSNKQEEILAFLARYLEENGHGPSIREIGNAVGLRSTSTVHYHLAELKRQGRIEMDERKKRTITLPAAVHGRAIPSSAWSQQAFQSSPRKTSKAISPGRAIPVALPCEFAATPWWAQASWTGTPSSSVLSQQRWTARSWWRCWATRPQSNGSPCGTIACSFCQKIPPTRPLTGAMPPFLAS